MKCLLIACHGQLGFELKTQLSAEQNFQLIATDRTQCNLENEQQLRTFIQVMQPDVIINAAAYTAVDQAESDFEKAWMINSAAVKKIAEEAKKMNALFIHFSTDYVFDGTQEKPYTENDTAQPLNVYGKSKLSGEQLIQQITDRYLIFRTSWLAGIHGQNFIKSILCLAKTQDTLSVVNDQWGSPTSANLLAKITIELLRKYQQNGAKNFSYGLYHVCSNGYTNWYEYACWIIDWARKLRVDIQTQKIAAIASSEYKTAAQRPLNVQLSTQLFQDTFGFTLPHWQAALEDTVIKIVRAYF